LTLSDKRKLNHISPLRLTDFCHLFELLLVTYGNLKTQRNSDSNSVFCSFYVFYLQDFLTHRLNIFDPKYEQTDKPACEKSPLTSLTNDHTL